MSEVQKLYVALLGRPADPSGLAYFDALSHALDRSQLVTLVAGESEFGDRFVGLNDSHRVNLIYNSLFGRDTDMAGVSFWLDQLKTGVVSANSVAVAISDAAQGTDRASLEAKFSAADLFTSNLDLPLEQETYRGTIAAAVGRAYINSVDGTHPGTAILADAMIYQIASGQATSPRPSDAMQDPAHAMGAMATLDAPGDVVTTGHGLPSTTS